MCPRSQHSKIRLSYLTILSAVLIVFAFPPWNQWYLILFALVPWLLIEPKAVWPTVREAVGLGSLMTLGGFFWVSHAIHRFGELPQVVALLGLFLFSLGNQPQFALFALLRRWILRKFGSSLLVLVALAAAYVTIDAFLPKLFLDSLGHSLVASRSLRQGAEILGVHGLTFLVILINLLLAEALRPFIGRTEPSLWPALGKAKRPMAVLVVILGLALFSGGRRATQIEKEEDESPAMLQLAMIQGNIGDIQKVAAYKGLYQAGETILQTYLRMSEEALRHEPKPEVIVWPETAYPSSFRTPMNTVELARDQRIERFVSNSKTPLFFGGYDRQESKDFNSVFMLSPQSENDLKIYHKYVLLPFGEYVPGFGENSIFKQLFPNMGFFGQGSGPKLYDMHLKNGTRFNLLPLICYEALVPAHTLLRPEGDRRLILNVTNDSWFGNFGEPELHLALSVFRSLEARVAQVRSTNTGISALILPSGRLVSPSPKGEEVIVHVKVPLLEARVTWMMRLGRWVPGIFLGLTLVALALEHLRIRPRRRQQA